MQVVLIMFRSGGERRSFSVVRSTTTIGRREDCDLRIPVGDVSRKHCRLVLSPRHRPHPGPGQLQRHVSSTGPRSRTRFLNPGDTVAVGPVTFVVQIDGVPDEADLASPARPGETGVGGTALAVAALTAAESAGPAADREAADLEDAGDLLAPAGAGDDLLTEGLAADDISTENAAYQDQPPVPPLPTLPSRPTDATVDELPGEGPAESVQDLAFDSVELDDPAADASVLAPAEPPADGDRDFLVEDAAEPGKSHADLEIDLD